MRLFLIALCFLLTSYHPSVFGAVGPHNMVLVPAGEFMMGTSADSDGLPDEHPLRLVYVSAFWIDRYEVTNTLYQQFVQATGYQAPANASPASTLWEHNAPLPGIEQHPVVNVSWLDAVAFCHWAEKRLPTEAEWEKAARGTDGRTYPWGKDGTSRKAIAPAIGPNGPCSLPTVRNGKPSGSKELERPSPKRRASRARY